MATAKSKSKAKSKFSSVDDDGTQLPSGWFATKDPSGKTYYFNKATRATKWERPTEADATGPAPAKAGTASKASSK